MTLAQPCKSFITLLFTIISAFLVMPANSSALPSNSVKNITFYKKPTLETAIVFLEKLPKIKFFVLHNPERIIVDIKDAFVPQINIKKETRGEAIKRIRVGQNKKNTARIVLDINKDIQYDFKIKKEMVDGKPAVKIMVSSLKKERKKNSPPSPILFDPIETNAIPPEKSFEKITVKEPEGSLVLFDDAMPNDIFNKTDKQEKKSDFSISGILHVRTTLQAKKNNSLENNTTIRNRIKVETRYKNLLTLSALSDYLYFGKENETDEFDLDLHEAKWQYNGENYGFSIGRQIIRWGKADQISPVDTLNPQDMREFIIPEYEERKIPIWMADLNLFFDKFILEGVFIPFFEKSRMDYFGTDWSIFG
ncbi:MAG: AMIN domain-containing protein, partial [Desulfobacula sp.]|nr:AMIN domain-containing protein [Desulfobacula sp.]